MSTAVIVGFRCLLEKQWLDVDVDKLKGVCHLGMSGMRVGLFPRRSTAGLPTGDEGVLPVPETFEKTLRLGCSGLLLADLL